MTRRAGGIGAYVAITAAYWSFMLTDGVLRMLVLLHFHTLGFSPLQLAYLFLLYELAGMVTNLSAGWIAARFGLTTILYAGLALQIAALIAMAGLDPAWSIPASVAFVACVQGASGVAKDLAKMSAKSAVKLLAPEAGGALFRWVAALTGSKNAVKGFGFLLGAGLLGLIGFAPALLSMATALAAVLLAVAAFAPRGLSRRVKDAKFRDVFSTEPGVNRLSAARLFLFGARDAWFVVGVPIFFYGVLSDGTTAGNRAAFFQIGVFMAAWTIFYGVIQGLAPKILRAREKSLEDVVALARFWVGVLALIPAGLAVLAASGPLEDGALAMALAAGLLGFGGVFAVNSAIHSYLILAFTSAARVTMDVGFYYMSNAAGRLLGVFLSGVSYQAGGIAACLGAAALMAGASFLVAGALRRPVATSP